MADPIVFGRLVELLREIGYPFIERFEPHLLEIRFAGRSGPIHVYALTLETSQEIVMHSVAPFVARPEDFARTAEFLCRANCGLSQGTFELNYSSGQLRFRTSLYVDPPAFTARLVQKLLVTNCLFMDKYMAALGGVVLDRVDPAEAIRRAEEVATK